jgi:hypothetical protein
MAYTQDELAREVVAEMFSLASGQPANPEDLSRVNFRLPGVIAELTDLNIMYIVDAASVPDGAFNSVVTYAAQVLAPNFGLPTDETKKNAAEAKLRTLQRIGSGTGGPLKTDPALQPRRGGYYTPVGN